MKISKPFERYTKKAVLVENGHKTILELACAVSKPITESVNKDSVWSNQISNRLTISFFQTENDIQFSKFSILK